MLPGAAFAHESGIHLHTDIPSTIIVFAEVTMDKDPFEGGLQFDSKPLDEAEQDDQDLESLWTTCIVIVAGLLIARIAFQIVKKRIKRSN
tara:strand:+ start:1017 stop:1286 length:270 start_codon:yes stop_codon:yes gene_type:complete